MARSIARKLYVPLVSSANNNNNQLVVVVVVAAVAAAASNMSIVLTLREAQY